MGKKSGAILVLITLMSIAVMIEFIDLPEMTPKYQVSVIDNQGKIVRTNFEMLKKTNYFEEKEIYQRFNISFDEEQGQELQIDISNSWLKKRNVQAENISITLTKDNSSTELTAKQAIYADSIACSITPARSGVYTITVPRTEIFRKIEIKPLTRNIIWGLVILVIIVLFIGYHYRGKKEKSHHQHEQELEDLGQHVRKMLLEGKHDEHIREALRKQGVNEKNIDQTLRRVRFL